MSEKFEKLKNNILAMVERRGNVTANQLIDEFGFSRAYILRAVTDLIKDREIFKYGSTRRARYVSRNYLAQHSNSEIFLRRFKNKGLEEHVVYDELRNTFPDFKKLTEQVRSILFYAFSEMLNNAIDHSQSDFINVLVHRMDGYLEFTVEDSGIGVFRNVKDTKGLASEIEAVQDILKGKTTTMPRLHSGEGIFFTSKVADYFVLDSYGYRLTIDNEADDVFLNTAVESLAGTRVTFRISLNTVKHLSDVFADFTNQAPGSDYGFDKTEIRVELYALGGIHVSRAQARRVLSGLEKFHVIVMDYDNVPTVGQAFADEVYRVFLKRYPDKIITNENMNEGVAFMVNRAIKEAEKEHR